MSVLLIMTMPEGVPMQFVDELTKDMNVSDDPPVGLVAHVHHEHEGRVRVVDIWESRAAYDTFTADRLGPAMQRVAERHGIDLAGGPQPEAEFFDASDPVIGR